MLSIEQLLRLINDWVKNQRDRNRLKELRWAFEQEHLNQVLRTADETKVRFYHGYPNPSPLKIAGCYAYALAREQPIVLGPAAVVPSGLLPADDGLAKATAMLNAEMALDCGLYLVSNAKYDCKHEITPPFDLKFPSEHFRSELQRSLACNEVTIPGLAYIFEVILLTSNKGKGLAGSLD